MKQFADGNERQPEHKEIIVSADELKATENPQKTLAGKKIDWYCFPSPRNYFLF